MSTNGDAVESGNEFKLRNVLRLVGQILIWIADDKRSLVGMLRLLQLVNDRPDFEEVLDAPPPALWDKFLTMLIRACDFFTKVDSRITGKNFPYQAGDLELKPVEVISIKQKLRELGVSVLTTRQVLDYLDSLGYRPARLVELLWWWIMNPAKRDNCMVVALGSVWEERAPHIHSTQDGRIRKIYLDTEELFTWDEDFEFAAVRK